MGPVQLAALRELSLAAMAWNPHPASGCRPKGPRGVTWSGCSCPKELGRSVWSQQGFLVEAAAAEITRRAPLGSSAMRASGTTSDTVSQQHILNCVCGSDNGVGYTQTQALGSSSFL